MMQPAVVNMLHKVRNFALDRDLLQNMEALDGLMAPEKADLVGDDDAAAAPILASVFQDIEASSDRCVEDHVYNDVEFFRPYVEQKKQASLPTETLAPVHDMASQVLTVFNHLSGGKMVMEKLLANPTSNFRVLMQRQECLKKVSTMPGLTQDLQMRLAEMAVLEPDVLWAFKLPSEEAKALYDMVYFRSFFLKKLNASPACLTAYAWQRIIISPLIGIATPLVYILLPFFILRYHGLNMSFISYIRMLYRSFSIAGTLMTASIPGSTAIRYFSCAFSLLFYFQSLFASVEVSRTLWTICKILCNKMHNVHRFLVLSREMWTMCRDKANIDIASAFSVPSLAGDECGMHTVQTVRQFHLLSNFGEGLTAFRNFDRDGNGSLVAWTYLLDAVVALDRARRELMLCFVDFQSALIPCLELRGTWHPCLPPARAVRNDVTLGRDNMILTGPNAGGKSTLLKAILVGTIFAQTVTLAAATSARISPFRLIRSQINVPDCNGSQSLFEAEMFRCKESLDKLTALDAMGQNALVVMDEIFSSTNVVEGISGAYAVAKALSSLPRTISIISTHFLYLCRLEKDPGSSRFKNHKMSVDISKATDDNDTEKTVIRYPYILTRGISKQFVALDLLKQNGFDEKLLADAMQVRASLTRAPLAD